jgi:hypothetical protein
MSRRPKLTGGGYTDLTSVPPETWQAIGGTEEDRYGRGYCFGVHDRNHLEHWQWTGEYPKGHFSPLSPQLRTYNVGLTFDPEEQTLEIEFMLRGRTVYVRNTGQRGDQLRKQVSLAKVPNRRAKADMLKWNHTCDAFVENDLPKHWESLVDLYLSQAEAIFDNLMQKREDVIDLSTIDQ